MLEWSTNSTANVPAELKSICSLSHDFSSLLILFKENLGEREKGVGGAPKGILLQCLVMKIN